MKVLVTGAGGFVGRAVCARLAAAGHAVSAGLRTLPVDATPRDGIVPVAAGDVVDADWRTLLRGHDAVVHLAARVHVMRDTAADPLAEFRRVNATATERLAREAAAAGVGRVVLVSSIKVNGEATPRDAPFDERSPPAPVDPYGVSKLDAERALQAVAAATGLQAVIVRPPLVYGPGVGGNFLRMMHWVARGVPLPLASVDNRRSLIAVDNLADLLERCVVHPAAAGRSLLAADGDDLSTPRLLRELGDALGRPARLLPCPPALLALAGRALGRGAEVQRLTGSLRVDASLARRELGWQAPLSVAEGLARTAAWFRGARAAR